MTSLGTSFEPLTLKEIQSSDNLTEFFYFTGLNEEGKSSFLTNLAQKVVRGYKIDKESRKDWDEVVEKSMKIAKLTMESKNFPWPKAANMKYPLITKASINFASRIRPELFPNDRIVRTRIQGKDVDGSKFQRGERVSSAMSYQLLTSPDWINGVDSLLHILPVVGTVFKKTYYDEVEKRNISEVCCPDQIIVNYNIKSLATASRITHIVTKSINDVVERQRRGLYNQYVDVHSLRPDGCNPEDDDFQITLLEQMCWVDLDNDGYKEPYMVLVHEKTLNVLRIVSCIDEIEKNSKGEILKIIPEYYYTDFHFIKSPDGGYYSQGFGHLLLALNLGINTTCNQLVNAGLLSTTQGGFLGKGLRFRDGNYSFRPFEWKTVDAAPGSKLADSIYPFPVREPSQTLFNLLNLMIEIGNEITNATEAFTGDLTGTNTSQSVMNTLVEQSAKGMYVAIHTRLFDSMAQEYKKLQKLNYKYLSQKEYVEILDDEEADVKKDFDYKDCDVLPVADPNLSTTSQRLQKIQILMSLRTANPQAVDLYTLRTLQFDENEIKEILTPPPPQPPPAKDQKDLALAKKASIEAELAISTAQQAIQQLEIEKIALQKQLEESDARIHESAARVWKMQEDALNNRGKLQNTGTKIVAQEGLKQFIAKNNQQKDAANIIQRDKELDIKGAQAAADAALENKKLDIMREKQDDEKQNNNRSEQD